MLARLEHYFPHLARSYIEINKLQRREFFGLRDFYRCAKESYLKLTSFTKNMQFNQNVVLDE